MSQVKFPKLLDYEKLKQEFRESDPLPHQHFSNPKYVLAENNSDTKDSNFHNKQDSTPTTRSLTGSKLRSYAFAVLTRKEYSKVDLIEKLLVLAKDREEVLELVEELSKNNYQSDQRVAEMTVRSQVRKGKGPNRIKQSLRSKHIDNHLIQNDLADIDWYEQAYQLKVKKFGIEVTKDPKTKGKQIRFLQYRGFEMDAIMKAISRRFDKE